ncbi:hypothetical protein JXA88_00065 [Candidatus Fermentibacteria bacterium]|nr:hypothetical protein [Candidatus Fermentibacteria bacterium]
MVIDHDDVARLEIIERYLRDELTPEEEQEWEAHYFQCDECFKALEETSQIKRFVKREVAHPTPLPARAASVVRLRVPAKRFHQWLLPVPAWKPILAAAAAAVIVGIPATLGWVRVAALRHEVHALRMPSAGLLTYVAEEGTRGEEPSVVIPKDAGRFLLQFNVVSRAHEETHHRARIIDARGAVAWSGAGLQGHGPYGTFAIACHSSFFTPGDYELHVEEVRPGDGAVMNRFVFLFRIAPVVSSKETP